MVIIIDGYNVLKQAIKTDYATEKQRQKFIETIIEYNNKKKHVIVLVFDGGPDSYATYNKRNLVTIVYAGARKTADEYIKHYIQDTNKTDMLIVTSDRGLYSFAARYGIASLDALVFYDAIKEAQKGPALYVKKASGKAQKLHQDEENQELDELMQQGGEILMYKDDQDTSNTKNAQAQKLSKHERKIVKIIKKL